MVTVPCHVPVRNDVCPDGAEAHTLLEEIADATLDGTHKDFFAELTTVPLLIIDDLGMRKTRA